MDLPDLETWLREPLTGYSGLGWAGLVGLGLVIQLFAWLLINRGLGRINIALGTLGLSFQQVATPFFAAWFLHEPLRVMGMCGGTLIVAGIYLVATGEQPRKSKGTVAVNDSPLST